LHIVWVLYCVGNISHSQGAFVLTGGSVSSKNYRLISRHIIAANRRNLFIKNPQPNLLNFLDTNLLKQNRNSNRVGLLKARSKVKLSSQGTSQ
jgi:hypothetical protein